MAIKAGGAVYVTKCSPVEVVPRTHTNCTEEILVVVNGTEATSATSSRARGPPYIATTWPLLGIRWVASGTAATPS